MLFDDRRFPHATSYLARLPAGFDSYPDCLTRYDSVEDQCALLRDCDLGSDLPEELRRYINGELASDWVPTVVAYAGMLVLRDRVFASDEALWTWSHDNIRRVIQRPLYRAIMAVFSTTTVVMDVTRRWQTFHRGSSLVASPAQKQGERLSAQITFSYPAHAFTELGLRNLRHIFLASVEASRPSTVRVDLAGFSETRAEFMFFW